MSEGGKESLDRSSQSVGKTVKYVIHYVALPPDQPNEWMDQRTTRVLTAGEAHTAKVLPEDTGVAWGVRERFHGDFCRNLGS